MLNTKYYLFLILIFLIESLPVYSGIFYKGKSGPGLGKHIVIIAGDEEYRSEESMPMMGKILNVRHGYDVTVLWSINQQSGYIDPNSKNNIPGLKVLESADIMILFVRFRELPDSQMVYLVDYINSGKPIIGIRTSTHAFNYPNQSLSIYSKFHFENRDSNFLGGFGRQVLGVTWEGHKGTTLINSSKAVLAPTGIGHSITSGINTFWAHTDVYNVPFFDGPNTVLINGIPLSGMNPNDPPMNSDTIPVAWLKEFPGDSGNNSKVFTVTMGGGEDFKIPELRRLLVNASYWLTGLEHNITDSLSVDYVDPYVPQGTYKDGNPIKNIFPEDFAIQNLISISPSKDYPMTIKYSSGRLQIISNTGYPYHLIISNINGQIYYSGSIITKKFVFNNFPKKTICILTLKSNHGKYFNKVIVQ